MSFHPRCRHAIKGVCDEKDPPFLQVETGHKVRCVLRMNEFGQRLEQLFASAWLDRDVYHRDDELKIHWPSTINDATPIAIRGNHLRVAFMSKPSPVCRPVSSPIWARSTSCPKVTMTLC